MKTRRRKRRGAKQKRGEVKLRLLNLRRRHRKVSAKGEAIIHTL